MRSGFPYQYTIAYTHKKSNRSFFVNIKTEMPIPIPNSVPSISKSGVICI